MISRAKFRTVVRRHYRVRGRQLPWRNTSNPYRILVSELMLQQTQAGRVIPKYKAFLQRFPTLQALAEAPQHEVLRQWQGLGYNRRALYLHRTAKEIGSRYGNRVPENAALLSTLPGIGKNTAGAIRAFAFDKPAVFVETNIRSVIIHFFFKNKERVDESAIERLVAKTLPSKKIRTWYYALTDYGAQLKQGENPNRKSAGYVRQPRFKGSRRELRGKIIKLLVSTRRPLPKTKIIKTLADARTLETLAKLEKERFVKTRRGSVRLL